MTHQAVYQPVESQCVTSAISTAAESIIVRMEGCIQNLTVQQLGQCNMPRDGMKKLKPAEQNKSKTAE